WQKDGKRVCAADSFCSPRIWHIWGGAARFTQYVPKLR
ncbi:MAG: hypothetical protein ACI9VX_000687, partial [Dinoroseobacter sp.]